MQSCKDCLEKEETANNLDMKTGSMVVSKRYGFVYELRIGDKQI